MKKTLALLLALLMLMSVALVSCGDKNKETEPNDENDPFGNYVGSESDDGTGETDESGNPKETDDDTTSDFVAASGTYYLRHTVYVSKDGKKKGTEGKNAGTLKFGTQVTVTAENSKWFKITFDGKEGYIHKDVVTANKDLVTYKAYETPVSVTLANIGMRDETTPATINLRTSPWLPDEGGVYSNIHANIAELQLKDGDAVEVLGEMGAEDSAIGNKWVLIRFTTVGAKDGKTYENVMAYCSAKFVQENLGTPEVPADPNTPPVMDPM